MQQFEMVSETAVHQRYLTVYDRRIKFCAHDNPAEVSCLDAAQQVATGSMVYDAAAEP
jgi:hypothetical protein